MERCFSSSPLILFYERKEQNKNTFCFVLSGKFGAYVTNRE